jgi:hypothetical protein
LNPGLAVHIAVGGGSAFRVSAPDKAVGNLKREEYELPFNHEVL